MTKQIVSTQQAPAAIGPYSQAVIGGDTLYCSGQIGLIPETGILESGLEAQVERAFSNLKAVCEKAGTSLDNTLKFTLFLVDMRHFALVNEIMMRHVNAPYPARSCVAVASLPKAALFEVEAIVAMPR